MKKPLLLSIRFLVIMILMTMFSGCFMFKKKNRCGDCPKWKLELKELFLQ